MLDVLRCRLRKKIHTETFLSYSFLPLNQDGRPKSFGPLVQFVETRLQSESELQLGPYQSSDVLLIMLEGSLQLLQEGQSQQQLEKHQVAVSTPAAGGFIRLANTATAKSRYLEAVFQHRREPIQDRLEIEDLSAGARRGTMLPVASGQGQSGALDLGLDSAIYRCRLRPNENLLYETLLERRTFLLILYGTIGVSQERLLALDSARITQESRIELKAHLRSDLLLIDLP